MKKARKKRIVRRKRRVSERRAMQIKRGLMKRAKKLRLGAKRTGAYVYGTLRRIVGNPAIPAHMGNPEFVREFRIGEMRARVSGEPVGLYAYRTKGGWGFITRKQSMYRPPGEELVVLFGEKRGLRGNPFSEYQRQKIQDAINECNRFIKKESARRADLRPPAVQQHLDFCIAHKAKLLKMLGYDVAERYLNGNPMRSSFDKPIFGPGQAEYRRVDTTTLAGMKEAERLQRAGWYQGPVTLFSTTYYRKRALPKGSIGRALRGNPAMVRPDPWVGLKILTPAEALREFKPLRKSISDESEPLLFFRTPTAESPRTIASLARKIGHYNDFNGRKVATVIERIGRIYPKVSIVLGREYSPALWLDNVYEDFAPGFMANAKKFLKTSEESYDPLRRRIRLWWD